MEFPPSGSTEQTHFSLVEQQDCLFLRADRTLSRLAPCTCVPSVHAIDTQCTVNPCGETLAPYPAHLQHLSVSPPKALFTSTHLVCEGCGLKEYTFQLFLQPPRRQQTSAN